MPAYTLAQPVDEAGAHTDTDESQPLIVIETEQPLTTEIIEESLGREQNPDGTWVDSSHEYIGTKADDLAIYLDRFFGSPIEDLESADSTMRFTTRFQWDEDNGEDIKFRLRGNVHLPRINNKLSLVFNGEDDEYRGGDDRDENNNQVGLQLNAAESKRSRFDVTLSVSSDLNLKPGVRYRFKNDLGEWGRVRYTGRVDYSDKERFRQRHTAEIDYLTGETSLLRWANKLEHGQRSQGVEWGSVVSWRYGYSIDSAVAVLVGANGKTEPGIPEYILEDPPYTGREPEQDSLVVNYGVVVKFRNRLYKDWLYVEFEPGYTNRQRHHYEDRHGVFFGRINFEILFNRGRDAKKNKEASDSANDRIAALTPEGY
ncbi:MAG: hypothetical protein V7742_21440 [Halioglobus sp.]